MIYDSFKKNLLENDLIQKDDNVIMLNSFGKDSVVLLHLLLRMKQELDFNLSSVLFKVPRHGYGNQNEFNDINKYWYDRGIELIVINFDSEYLSWENNEVNPDDLPCPICRDLRNQQIRAVIEKYKPDVMASGFNLTDMQNYLTTMMLISDFSFNKENMDDLRTANRFTNLLPRFHMKVNSTYYTNLLWILPLIIFSDHEIDQYIVDNQIPYVKQKCKFKEGRAREAFSKYINLLHSNYGFKSSYSNLLEFLYRNSNDDIPPLVNDQWLLENAKFGGNNNAK